MTGDRVRLEVLPDGQQSANVLPASGHGAEAGSSAFVEFTWDSDVYVVPDSAVPYLGRALDPRLFDVSYLARAGLADGHASALPVHVRYRGAVPPGLPGVHVGRVSGRVLWGTVAKARAGLLGQLLARQWRAARAGRSPVPIGRLPGIARISLAPPRGSPPPSTVPSAASARTGGVPFRTLTLRFTGLDGRPAAALGFVQNVGDARLALFTASAAGSASVSVPQGTYSIEFSVLTPHSSGPGFDTALVVRPQFRVASDETLRLDARAARPLRVTLRGVAAPPATEEVLDFTRASQTGGQLALNPFDLLGLRVISLSPDPYHGWFASRLLATPTRAVTRGIFGFAAYSFLSPTVLGTGMQSRGPTYFLSFPHSGGIPASLTYRVPAADLTAVHEGLYDAPGTPPTDCGPHRAGAGLVYTVYQPSENSAFAIGDEVPLGNRTDYWYTSAPSLDLWQAAYNGCDFLRRWGAIQQIRPGQQITGAWGKAPIVPAPAAPPVSAAGAGGTGLVSGPRVTVCAACRQGDIGMLYLLPFGDSDPSHYAEDFGGRSQLRFYRGATLAITSASSATGQLTPFAFDLPMLRRPATYRLNWIQARPGQPAAADNTDWTFRSGPGSPGRRTATQDCAPDPARGCAFLPLLFINYNLALDFRSQAEAGTPFRIAFTVGYQQHQAAPSRLSATVSVSYDDGQTWTPPRAAASRGGGNFAVTIDQPPLPATTGFVSLRVAARDQAGNSVVQTITRAYGLHG